MIFLVLFAFLSGIMTIFAPCVWPILPVVLSSSIGGRRRPFGIVAGLAVSFTLFTLIISVVLRFVPLSSDDFRLVAAIIIAFFGMTLLFPTLGKKIETLVTKLSSRTPITLKGREGFKGGFLTGAALGLVWSPCAGPILGTVASLAATQTLSPALFLITIAFVSGVALPLLGLALLGQRILGSMRSLSRHTLLIQRLFGIAILLSALAILTGYDLVLQERFAEFCTENGITFLNRFQNNAIVTDELMELRAE